MITVPFALLSAFSTSFELSHAIRLSRITRLFVEPSLLPLALQSAKEAGLSDRNIHVIGGRKDKRISFGDIIANIRNKDIKRIDVQPATTDTLAYLIFSSGTTGLPKG
jgi:long-subunit acyl-CoA synthetase (AMP-forming)